MAIEVTPNPDGFGASVSGTQLSEPLTQESVEQIRAAWLTHQVLSFPDQPLSHAALERFCGQFGEFGNDPYVAPLADHEHILEVRREPDEAAPPFGSAWHSDWSFQTAPPAATVLHAKEVPSRGGETLFADGYSAYATLEPNLRAEIESLTAIHSARRPYSHEGYQATGGERRSMRILPSKNAWATQEHPMVRTHPETGRPVMWINPVYTIGVKGLSERDSGRLLDRLFAHYLKDEFVYRHQWRKDMLTMWDNRCVMHRALGGYDGERRVMHRVTLAGDQPY